MNKIYLYGQVIYKSKLKYIIEPKLEIYMEIAVKTISGDVFNIIAYEDKCNFVKNIKLGNYIFAECFGIINKGKFQIYINKISL